MYFPIRVSIHVTCSWGSLLCTVGLKMLINFTLISLYVYFTFQAPDKQEDKCMALSVMRSVDPGAVWEQAPQDGSFAKGSFHLIHKLETSVFNPYFTLFLPYFTLL